MSRTKTEIGKKVDSVANIFGVSTRTVQKWREQGCNIFDSDEVYAFHRQKTENLRAKKIVAQTEEQALNGKRQDQAGLLNFDLIQNLPAPTGEGAAAALRRLQGLESIFYSRQLEALAKGRNDLISYALSDYKRITQTLLDYERQVELAMRDSGQLIARGDAEKGAGAVARWFRLGWRLWLSSCTPDLLQFAGDARAFKAKAEETFSEIMKAVFTKARDAKVELPAWALDGDPGKLRLKGNRTLWPNSGRSDPPHASTGSTQGRVPLLDRSIIRLELHRAPSHLDQQHPDPRVTDFSNGTQPLLRGIPRGVLAGTQPPKTTDLARVCKSRPVKDLPIQLHQTQGSSTLGSWTLQTLG
jgi:hypothetical protein